MPVSAEQISKAKAAGLQNVDIAAKVADEVVDIIFYQLCALLEKESMGRNVYGGDSGGALRGFKGTVTKGNYAVFRWMIDVGVPVRQPDGTHKIVKFGPNGVGPMQITHPGLVADLKADGLEITDVHDNMLYGGKLWTGYYRGYRANGLSVSEAIVKAGCRYNTGSSDPCAYGDRLLVIMDKWRDLVGISDAKN